jgi:signal transduction histidine kinase
MHRWSVSLKLGLWLLVVIAATLSTLEPGFPLAVRDPVASVAASTASGLVGLTLLPLGVARFVIFGNTRDLLVTCALALLAAGNILTGVVDPLLHLEGQSVGYVRLIARAGSAVLFVLAMYRPGARVSSERRRPLVIGVVLGLAVAVAGLGSILLGGLPLPPLLDPTARALLARGESVPDFLAGQAPALVVANVTVMLLFLLAPVRWLVSSTDSDPELPRFGFALALLAIGQIYTVLVPSVAIYYVSTGDLFRLAGYLAFLVGFLAHLASDIAELASSRERLRLSRELHDGLAQQLGLLNMRLGRALAPDHSPEVVLRDVEVAKRLGEAALLEARQAITTLRSGRVSWDEFVRAAAAYTEEFAQGYEVEVRLRAGTPMPFLEATLQAEVLRVIQEALSNAVRHGGSTRIHVSLRGNQGYLELDIRDDGQGFEVEQALAKGGIGLQSIRERVERVAGRLVIASRPGAGAHLSLCIPVGQGGR